MRPWDERADADAPTQLQALTQSLPLCTANSKPAFRLALRIQRPGLCLFGLPTAKEGPAAEGAAGQGHCTGASVSTLKPSCTLTSELRGMKTGSKESIPSRPVCSAIYWRARHLPTLGRPPVRPGFAGCRRVVLQAAA
jgi:hypothetical protein